MPMPESLDARVRHIYEDLSAGQRRLADLLIECMAELPAYSATELASRAGVSKATAARLFRRLGYNDFSDLHQQARDMLYGGSPLQAMEVDSVPDASLARHLAQELRNLTRSIESTRSDVIGNAIDWLADAGHVWVVGFRNSFALAHYAHGLLAQARPDVLLLPVGGLSVAEDFAGIGPQDVLLAVGFRRRPPLLGRMITAAKAAQAKVILVTELPGPDAGADAVIRCHTRSASPFDSYVAPMGVLHYLCGGVALARGKAGRERLARIEKLHEELGDFGSGGNF